MARAVRGGGRLDTSLLIACSLLSVLALVLPDSLRQPVATAIRQTVLAPLVSVQRQSETIRSAILARDQQLRLQGDIATRALTSPALEAENAQLRKLVGLGARLQRNFVIAEALETKNFDKEFTLTITAGSSSGVVPFTPVVTADGLVGMVQQVDPAMSFAISWANPDFAVSAMSEDGTAFGIVKPHLGTGAERWLLELRGVPFRAALKIGTRIVSSGMGATYPRGIPVGTVLAEIQTSEKWARTFLLKPAVLPDAPGPVILLLAGQRATVNGVWTTLASSDSAARSIAAAGDSIARKAALAELAARRAALDSAQKDSLGRDSIGRKVMERPDSIRRATARDSTRVNAPKDSVRRPPKGPPPPEPQ